MLSHKATKSWPTYFCLALLTLTACTSHHAPQATEPPQSYPPYDTKLDFTSAKPALDPDYHASGADNCPAFPEVAKDTTFGPNYRFIHHTWHTQKSASLKCTLRLNDEAPTNNDTFELIVTKGIDSTEETVQTGYLLFQNTSQLLRNKKLNLHTTVPGYGFLTENKSAYWQCGPYRIEMSSYLYSSVQPRVFMNDIAQALEFHATDLCGTTSNPSKEVQNSPYSSWAIYDAFGGTSPADYGVPRPTNMTAGAPRPLVTPTAEATAAKPSSMTPSAGSSIAPSRTDS